MKLDPINLIGGFYQDDNLPWSAQDTVNWIPRPAEMPGTISQMKLVGAPGLSFLADIDDDPVRIGGFRNVEGRMFIVAGTTLYELNTDLTTTVRGTIPGAGPVTMAHNQLEFGNELCIGNGSGTLYVWNTWTSTFTVVTDDAATGSVQSVYLNRRIIHLDPFGRFGYPSEIDSATSYDSLDRFDSEVSPDKFVGIGESQFELVGISQRTTEFYSDTGATEQPFRPKRIAINRGCAARNSIVKLGGTLAMLGDDGIFYRLQGYQWEPISTGPVNKAIEGNNWANCFGFVYEDRKHEIAYWTFPDGQTWGYDAWTGLIHRRESFGLNRWRINAIEKWNDMWIAGDFQSGRIYRIDWDAYHENGQPLVARRVAPPIYNNGNAVVCPMIDLVFDTGRGTIPQIVVSGDLPNGFVTDSGSIQYSATGGIGEFTFSIVSGSLPPGASMSSDGTVPYAYTTVGSYSWVVRATDAFGGYADHPDSAVVGLPAAPFLTQVFEPTIRKTSTLYNFDVSQNIGVSAAAASTYSAGGKIFVLGGAGVRVSHDQGANWQACSGIGAANDYIGIAYNGTEWLIFKSDSNLAWVSTDGITFTTRSFAPTISVATTVLQYGDTIMVARTNSSFSRISTDGGQNWSDMALVNSTPVWMLARNPVTGVLLGVGGFGVMRSANNGTTWSFIPSSPAGDAIAFMPDLGRFVVFQGSGAMQYTDDDGDSFQAGGATALSGSQNFGMVKMVFDGLSLVILTNSQVFTSVDGVAVTARNAATSGYSVSVFQP